MSLTRTEVPLAKTGFILANGMRIRTAAWPSDGYPAVFVHGLSSGWQTWLPPLAYLWPTLSARRWICAATATPTSQRAGTH